MDKENESIEIKSSSECICLNLRHASLTITKIYDYRLAQSGLTISQFSIMRNIKKFAPISVSDLALAIRLDRTTLVRNLKPLEKDGLIIDVSPIGRRGRQLQLTDKGIKCFSSAELLWNEAQVYVKQQFEKENLDKLMLLLSQIENI